MNKRLFFCLSGISIAFNLLAQQSEPRDTTIALTEVVVAYQANKLTPVSFQNISHKRIKSISVGQEPSFILAETPSVTAYSDAGSMQGYSYYRLRGIDQTRINMTLDGVPLNEPEDQGAYFSNYPDILNSVDRLQIQRGVGTTKNGMASYGGSIQLFSPNLRDSVATVFGVGYGSFNSLRAFGEYKSGLKGNKALYVRASQLYSDGYKYHSANNSQSVFVSGGLFYDKSAWKLNFLAGQQRNELAWLGVPDSLIAVDRKTNSAGKDEKDKFFQTLAQVQNIWHLTGNSTLQSSVYYIYLVGNYDFDLNNYLGMPSTAELYNYAFHSHSVGLFSNYTFSKEKFNFTTGFYGNIYDRTHTGSEKALGQLYENTGFKNEISVLAKADYTWHKFSFFADIQYRYATFDYKGDVLLDKMNWGFFNPKAGISFSVKDNSVMYYSVGRTGREPTRNDLFGGEDNLAADDSGKVAIAITTPEYVVDHELGFRCRSGKLTFDFNLFYMDFKNEIVLDGKFGPNGLALTDKVEQSIRTGVELNVSYQLSKHFVLVNNSSYNYSRITEQTEKFTPILTPPIIINQEVEYNYKFFSASVSVKYQDKSYIDFANTTAIDDYFLVNARLQYQYKCLQCTFFMNNITNAKYFNNGYVDFDSSKKYFVQAPANFYLSLIYKW
jgi:iron complex outermembrane receptor protein